MLQKINTFYGLNYKLNIVNKKSFLGNIICFSIEIISCLHGSTHLILPVFLLGFVGKLINFPHFVNLFRIHQGLKCFRIIRR